MVILRTFHYPESPILFQKDNTKAILDGNDLGNGTVYVSERLVSWSNTEGDGFSVAYAHIALHGVTTDPNVYHTKCLYLMINDCLKLEGLEIPNPPHHANGNGDLSDSDSEPEQSRLVFAPNDLDCVATLFSALCQGQTLNPDPQDSLDEDDEDDEDDVIYDDAEGDVPVHVRNGDVNNLSYQMQNNSIQYPGHHENGDVDENQFEDAD